MIWENLSNRRLNDILSNFVLLCVVLICWFYVLYAGKVMCERYLDTVNWEAIAERDRVINEKLTL